MCIYLRMCLVNKLIKEAIEHLVENSKVASKVKISWRTSHARFLFRINCYIINKKNYEISSLLRCVHVHILEISQT